MQMLSLPSLAKAQRYAARADGTAWSGHPCCKAHKGHMFYLGPALQAARQRAAIATPRMITSQDCVATMLEPWAHLRQEMAAIGGRQHPSLDTLLVISAAHRPCPHARTGVSGSLLTAQGENASRASTQAMAVLLGLHALHSWVWLYLLCLKFLAARKPSGLCSAQGSATQPLHHLACTGCVAAPGTRPAAHASRAIPTHMVQYHHFPPAAAAPRRIRTPDLT